MFGKVEMNNYAHRAINVAFWVPIAMIALVAIAIVVAWSIWSYNEAPFAIAIAASSYAVVIVFGSAIYAIETYSQFIDWLVNDWYFWKFVIPKRGINALFRAVEFPVGDQQ